MDLMLSEKYPTQAKQKKAKKIAQRAARGDKTKRPSEIKKFARKPQL